MTSRSFIIIVLVFLLLFMSGCLTADNRENNVRSGFTSGSRELKWESLNGPPGGRFTNLLQNPTDSNILYTATTTGVYKSSNKGENWKLLSGSQDLIVRSIALYKNTLFVCGNGLHSFDSEENLKKIRDEWCDTVFVSDNKLFVSRSDKKIENFEILYTPLEGGTHDWEDITPSPTELSDLNLPAPGFQDEYLIRSPAIIALGERVIAAVIVDVPGGSRLSNGYLYLSENGGKRWSKLDFGLSKTIIPAKIGQDLTNPSHVIVAFKHNILHEDTSPITSLVRESFDRGITWQPVKGLDSLRIPSNGITDVEVTGQTYYLLSPYTVPSIIKLDAGTPIFFENPKVMPFYDFNFGLGELHIDFSDPRIVYGITDQVWALGLVKSEDGMKTWKKMDRDIPASSPTIVLTHPNDPNVIFTSGNVIQEEYLTRNRGSTWEPFTPVAAGDEVRIDPHNPNHMLLMDEMTNLYDSTDGGRTFRRMNDFSTSFFSSAKVFDFEVAKDDPDKIYISNSGTGISKRDTLTTGGSWMYLTGSPDYSYDFEIDPEDSNVLYASYSPKIFENYSSLWKYSPYLTPNAGWNEIFHVGNSRGISTLRFDPSNPNVIYTGVTGDEGEIYVSRNKGTTWSKLNDALTFTTIWGHSQLQVDPQDKNVVYAGTWGGGTYKTADGGISWTKMDETHTFSPTCLAVSPQNPDTLYACDRTDPKIHKSTDGGMTWSEYYDFGTAYMLSSAIALDPVDNDTIYAAAFQPPLAHTGGLVKIKNGQKVADLSKGLPRSVIELEVDPRNRDILYAATHVHGVYKSMDGGNFWEQLDDRGNGLPRTGYYDIDVDPQNSSILYATALCGVLPAYVMPQGLTENIDQSARCGVYRSFDAGTTWEFILATKSEARGIEIDPDNDQNLYVADMMGGVWVSNDAGRNWRQENRGLDSTSMTSVKIQGDQIYASTQGSGVFAGVIRRDGSIEWDKARSNKPKARVYKIQIEVDPSNSQRIYASAYPGGLLRSDDGGKQWNDKNFLTPSIRVDDPTLQGYYSFAINPRNPNNIWLGVYGKGMFVSYDGMDYDMFASGAGREVMGKYITAVGINPATPNEVYVGSDNGVFITRDGGSHWQEMNAGLEVPTIKSLKIVNTKQMQIKDNFEDGDFNGWNLENGWFLNQESGNHFLQGIGHAWARSTSGSSSDYTFEAKVRVLRGGIHLNFRTSDEGRYFLGVREGAVVLKKQFNANREFADLVSLQESTDVRTWHDVKIEMKGNTINVFVDGIPKLNYFDSNPLPAGGIGFETLDESDAQIDDFSLVGPPQGPSVYVGTAGYGLYQFDPSQQKWKNLGRTLGTGWWSAWDRRMYQFTSLLFDPDDPGKIYLGHFPGGFFISEDNGHTWKDSSRGLGNDGIFSLTMHPQYHKILYAGTYNGVVKSTDGGQTWSMKSAGMPGEQWPYTIAIDSTNPNIMYTSTKNGQNKGFCSRNPGTFCGVVMKSTNGGEEWFRIMDGLNPITEFYTLIIYPPNHDILFVSTNRGVYMSKNAGQHWEEVNYGLPTIGGNVNNQVRDNVADNLALTADNKYLVLGLVDHGAWRADVSKFA